MDPDAALAVCRFAHDAAGMLLWGSFAYLAAVVPRGLAFEVAGRLEAVRRGAVVVAVAATAATLPVQAAAIGGFWADAVDPAMVRAVLFETGVGLAWQIQAAAAVALAAALAAPVRRRSGATALASAAMLATLPVAGHAAMHEGWLGLAHRLLDAAHILAAGAWLGALLPLLPVLRALDDPRRSSEAAVALRRFSTLGHGAVALVIATGVGNTMLVLGRWPLDAASPYQALLARKIALVAIVTLLAIVNRYAIVPRMAQHRGRSLALLELVTIAELGLAFVIVGCVGVLGLRDPA